MPHTPLFLILAVAGCSTAPTDASSLAPTLSPHAPDAPPAEIVARIETADTGQGSTLVFTGDVPRNLLFISVDTTRRDQLSTFSDYDSSPTLDGILTDGVVLADHRSCSSWTAPSMICATTGIMPIDEGWWPTGVYGQGDSLVPEIPSVLPNMAQTFKDAGFATALVTGNGVFSRNNGGISSGYDTELRPIGATAPVVANRAMGLLPGLVATGSPWLLHVHFMDPHTPYSAPDAYVEAEIAATGLSSPWDFTTSGGLNSAISAYWSAPEATQEIILELVRATYRAEIKYFDDSLATFWQDMDAMGVLDDTLVVFWTDHGEQHGEHGGFYHGISLNAQENRAAAGFWANTLEPARWEDRTFHQDIAPTVYDVMGVTPSYTPTGYAIGTAPDDRVAFTFNYLVGYTWPEFAVFLGDSQLYYNFRGSKTFYDLAADPNSDTDIYDSSDPRVRALWRQLLPKIRTFRTAFPHLPAHSAGP